jgi:hypothetical protein
MAQKLDDSEMESFKELLMANSIQVDALWSGNQDLMTSCCFFAKKENVQEDEASSIIIGELWKRLRETHKLRIVE